MSIRFKTVFTGALSYLPGAMPLYRRFAFRPAPAPAETSYGIWLKHLVLSQPHRNSVVPHIVAELGPGLSLGAGLAALICGAERYVALDAVQFAPTAQLLPIFEQLVTLFKKRVRPQNAEGFPPYATSLDAAGFPSRVLSAEHMAWALDSARIAQLRLELQAFVDSNGSESARITYLAPWALDATPQRGAIDFLFSHTVLQHVQSPQSIWQDVSELLCRGGVCSHQIAFGSHGTSTVWNGHWAYPEAIWRIALGRKTFLINREPLSTHIGSAQRAGMNVVETLTARDGNGMARSQLARRWQRLDDADLNTHSAFLVARKSDVHAGV